MSDITMETLQQENESLRKENNVLRQKLEGSDYVPVDELAKSVSRDVALILPVLAKQRGADLKKLYNIGYFKEQTVSPYGRLVVASALIAKVKTDKIEPLALWTTLVEQSGNLYEETNDE